jgi:hypothetical protein
MIQDLHEDFVWLNVYGRQMGDPEVPKAVGTYDENYQI